MDPNSILLSPQSRTYSHLEEPCMEGERSPGPREPSRDSPFSWRQVPSSSLADPNWFWDEHIQAKRARVETIIRGMCLSPNPLEPGNARARDSPGCPEKVRERKRKQCLPMQQGTLKPGPARDQGNRKGAPRVREQLYLLKQQLRHLQEHILQAAEPRDTAQGPGVSEKEKGPLSAKQRNACGPSSWAVDSDQHQVSSKDLSEAEKHKVSEVEYHQSEEPRFLPSGAQALLEILRKELTRAVSQAVDSVLQKFNRCITSQMIKWFSNFREFYYIQMEKFARQAVSDGITNPKMLVVLRDSELFRALNMHYNKGNDFEVPDCFLEIASLTLQEFFRAVTTGKDSDPSWKKPIYKIISKLDSDIPEIFKSSSYPQELFQS
ncbi:PREDICTED: prospero homeobox protein 2 [Galeopterus variegatus]|uniref:Prospero homeobox protein 2 n=1 Tax=Galeopterus variegatus TaxID=482537 RepID=A0ABM0QBJ0_GALVR|nr:PREDICTED: prospero homeobox protein 2 [Galeopterus variegatus]